MLTSVDRLLFIRSVPIFKELRDDFLVRLASVMDEMTFASNYTIITEGHEGRALYIVVSGRVRVHLRSQELAQLAQNACFGEMSVFDAEPRSASVTTLEPCNCLVLTQQQLYDAIDETPGIAVNIIRLLSRRIRELNRDLNQKQQELQAFQRIAQPYLQEASVPAAETKVSQTQENGQGESARPHGYFPYGQIPY
ncbi:Crp/Fnr family transcriptional regulator [Pseudanabaena sp. FACHB-2040]|uniref:Crp/Fnr family transcriptional regulator n=1 Tax=Pseudanabaena sp. FACHB-2040 TaxID=2692859 RepID=UPI00168668B2|nr:Crp/Fnr family transcriptional regulator [Pseudanabaena sp. FACHB-2040]MBD2258418.1 Crp/Fnr family transcriptional regulator [Pseudanabaena sp. FACHB-2040]